MLAYTTLGVTLFGAIVVVRRYGPWSLPTLVALMLALGVGVRGVVLELTLEQRLIYSPAATGSSGLSRAAELALAGSVATLLGIWFRGRGAGRKDGHEPVECLQPDLSRTARLSLPLAAALLALIVTMQVALVAADHGAIGAGLHELARRDISGSVSTAANLTFAALALYLYILRSDRRPPTLKVVWPIVGLALMPFYAILNGRTVVVLAVWALLMTSPIDNSRAVRQLAKGLVAGGAFVSVTILGLAWRMSAQQGHSLRVALGPVSSDAFGTISDAVPILDHTLVGLAYVTQKGFDFGRSLADALVIMIPRSVWDGKPILLPQEFAQSLAGRSNSGLPAGLFGELYVYGGVFALVAGSLAFGYAVASFQMRQALYRGELITTVRLLLLVGATQIIITALRVGVQGSLVSGQVVLVSLVALMLFMKLGASLKSGGEGYLSPRSIVVRK